MIDVANRRHHCFQAGFLCCLRSGAARDGWVWDAEKLDLRPNGIGYEFLELSHVLWRGFDPSIQWNVGDNLLRGNPFIENVFRETGFGVGCTKAQNQK